MSDKTPQVFAEKPPGSWPVAAPNGEIARVLLAFLATAGLFYVNIMPALVDGLIEGLGFNNQQAGFVGSANVYGAALGGADGIAHVLRSILAEADLIMAVDGYPSPRDLTSEALRRV